jgi:hypothetical protein
MKLATVKVEYTCGLTLTERVTLNVPTGAIELPPRLAALMDKMAETEATPAFTLEYMGYVLPVDVTEDGSYRVLLPDAAPAGFRRIFHSIAYPTKDQRQQNGRFLQTLSAASMVGAVGYAHAAARWDMPTVLNTATLACVGVILWYQGYLAMKGD